MQLVETVCSRLVLMVAFMSSVGATLLILMVALWMSILVKGVDDFADLVYVGIFQVEFRQCDTHYCEE